MSRGIISSFIDHQILAPFQPLQLTESKLLDQYVDHTEKVCIEVLQLLKETSQLLRVLNALENGLGAINALVYKDCKGAQVSKRDSFPAMDVTSWGPVCAGEAPPAVGLAAWVHATNRALKLQVINAELEVPKKRLGSMVLVRHRTGISLVMHFESAFLGLERLEKARKYTRGLQWNIIHRNLDRDYQADTRPLVEG